MQNWKIIVTKQWRPWWGLGLLVRGYELELSKYCTFTEADSLLRDIRDRHPRCSAVLLSA